MDSHPQNFSSDDDDTMAGVYNAWSKCQKNENMLTQHIHYIFNKKDQTKLIELFYTLCC